MFNKLKKLFKGNSERSEEIILQQLKINKSLLQMMQNQIIINKSIYSRLENIENNNILINNEN